MTAVRLRDDGSGVVSVNFAYDPGAIAILKDQVAGSMRSYDPQTKTWRVDAHACDALARALTDGGHTVLRGDETEPAPVETFFDETAERYDARGKAAEIVAGLPAQHVGKVFRAMAKLLYPDLYRR